MTFIVAEMKRKICASLFVCLAAFAYRNNKLNNIILTGLSITGTACLKTDLIDIGSVKTLCMIFGRKLAEMEVVVVKFSE